MLLAVFEIPVAAIDDIFFTELAAFENFSVAVEEFFPLKFSRVCSHY